MKAKFILILILLLGITSQVCANEYSYGFMYMVKNITGDYKINFGSQQGATDGYDMELISPGPYQSKNNIAQYKENGKDGWNGDTGFYISDVRSPLTNGQTAIFNFYVWGGTSASSQDICVYLNSSPWLSPGLTYALNLVQIPDGITYTGRRTWAVEYGNIILPFYSTDNPLTGYKFEATITAPPVPEPSSLLALFSGLAGIGGFALKRRRT